MSVGLKKRRRVQMVLIGFAMIIMSASLIFYALGEDSISYFRSPTQVQDSAPKDGTVFRLGGLVLMGSLHQNGDNHAFTITDSNADISVIYQGLLPDIFREGQGVIALGRMQDNQFIAQEILAKHDETYMPKEVIDALKAQGVYQPPNK